MGVGVVDRNGYPAHDLEGRSDAAERRLESDFGKLKQVKLVFDICNASASGSKPADPTHQVECPSCADRGGQRGQTHHRESKGRLQAGDHSALVNDYLSTESGRLSVPRPDHYYPLLYPLGASDADDEVAFPYEGIQNASISMRAVSFGL